MSYASQDELSDRYGADMLVGLTDRADPPSGAIDAAVVDRALSDAGALIDGYLKGRYQLPLASTPALVKDLALAIAIYKLHRTAASDKIAQDYADAVKTLVQVANGVVRLDVAGVEPPTSGFSGVKTNSGTPRIDACGMKGFV